MKKYGRGITVAILALGVAACSAKAPTGPPPKGLVKKTTTSVIHDVVAVDRDARRLTLRDATGEEFEIEVGEEVRNFDQIDVGDHVRADYLRALQFEVKRAGTAEPSATAIAGAARAELGDKPGALLGTQAEVTATIIAIDKKAGTVTLRDHDGGEETITPRRSEYLDQIAVGDLITLTYTEAVAVSVEETP